jgi:hypothetical protein
MTTDVEELVERARIAEEARALRQGTDMGGLLSDGPNKGLMRDVSDPMRLVTLYATATGEPREVPAWTLEPTSRNNILMRKNADGTPVFSGTPPAGKAWKLGTYPCLLSATHPERDKYVAMGLGFEPCKGEHLASPYAVEMHMRHRHSQEWQTIVSAEARERDDYQREFQRVQMQVAQQALNQKPAVTEALTCECGWETAKGANSLAAHKRLHCPLKDGA